MGHRPRATLPSADKATDRPCAAPPTSSRPTSFGPCWLHTPLLRVNTRAAFSFGLPTMAVLPSADRAMDQAPTLASLPPCCVHTPPLRVNTQTAPRGRLLLSLGPPTRAVS